MMRLMTEETFNDLGEVNPDLTFNSKGRPVVPDHMIATAVEDEHNDEVLASGELIEADGWGE